MRRFGKMLSGFGAIEVLAAVILLITIEHMPFPWGIGMPPAGLSSVGDHTVEWEMNLQAYVLIAIFNLGFIGLLFLVIGGLAYGMSSLMPKKASA